MLPENFDSLVYFYLNKELIENELDYTIGDMHETLCKHYITQGASRQLQYKLQIPEDFTVQKLIDLNPEIASSCNPLQLGINLQDLAYMLCIKHDLLYKLDLPVDFNANLYKKYNPDLKNISDKEASKHYCKHAKKENRVYKLDLPADFCVKSYKKYNPDLQEMTDNDAEKHYNLAGKKENRLYKVILPENFNHLMYEFLNPDLANLPKIELEKHYFLYGIKENRNYIDPLFDAQYFANKHNISLDADLYSIYFNNVTLIKSKEVEEYVNNLTEETLDLLLISHQTSFFGATHYLYSLYNYIKVNFPNKRVKIAEQYSDSRLTKKYNLTSDNVIVYHDDPTILSHVIKNTNPTKILFNSTNKSFFSVIKHIERNKCVLHSHEVMEHYKHVMKTLIPDFVVSQKIADQWNQPNINVQPPFIDATSKIALDASIAPSEVRNTFGNINLSKITVGMCGDLSDRKNPKIFAELAKVFPEINFLWIGGCIQFPSEELSNLYHIKNIADPYAYFKLFNYFMLTSLIDPCPYVVLENLYLNNKVIVFRDNIFTAHDKEKLKDTYFEYPGAISKEAAIKMLQELTTNEPKDTNQGYKYICSFFMSLSEAYLNKIL